MPAQVQSWLLGGQAWRDDQPLQLHVDRTPANLRLLLCSAAGANVVPQFVQSVHVYERLPLLRHVTLVDTPGLADPDAQRSAAA